MAAGELSVTGRVLSAATGMAGMIAAMRWTGRHISRWMGHVTAGRRRIPEIPGIIEIVSRPGTIAVVGVVIGDAHVSVTPVPRQAEIEDGGIVEGFPLVFIQERNKQVLFQRFIAFLADDHPDRPAGYAFTEFHIFVHKDRENRTGGGTQIEVYVHQIHIRAFGRGLDLECAI